MLFRERLTVPWSWWVLAGLLTVTMLGIVGFYVGPVWGIGVAVLTLAAAVALFVSAGIVISVDADELRVGRAVLERRYLGRCRALDAAETERRGGVDADVRAHLVLRPYVATAVEIELRDPADPVPYWLVSTRQAARLAAALNRVDAGSATS
jgi:hypothetical protein